MAYYIVLVFNIISFCINPLLSTLIIIMLTYLSNNKKFLNLMIINISLLFGLINSTKPLDGDLIGYYFYFLDAKNASLSSYLALFKADYLYYFMTYVFSNMSSWKMFIITITFISYIFIFFSIKLILTQINNLLTRDYVIVILIVATFYLLFSLSAHLVRNFLAASIVLFFLANYFFAKRNYWYLLIIAGQIHFSAFLFFFVYLVPRSNIRIYFVRLALIYAFIFFIVSLYREFLSYLYVFQRVNIKLEYLFLVFLIILFISTLFFVFLKKKKEKRNNNFVDYLLFFAIINIIGLIIYFYTKSDVILGRIILYNYFMLIPIYIFIFVKSRILLKLFNVIVLTIFSYFFIKNYMFGVWKYISFEQLILSSLFSFIEF